ncbi:MAG: BatD family protein [Deltaproteobacteria bacterium]|nr:BatD family protein [Deltaproteobacteria bacterium]
MRAALAWPLVALLVLGFAPPARAQAGAPDLTATISAAEVQVGEPFTIELRAMTETGDSPHSPLLRAPPELAVSGPHISSQTRMQFGMGRSVVETGISARWQLVGNEEGSFTIPAPTVMVGPTTYQAGGPLHVRVIAASGAPFHVGAGSPLGPGSPFGGMGGSFPFPFPFPAGPGSLFDDDDDLLGPGTPEAHELALAAPRAAGVFLRSVADKRAAIVGEQVTLSHYLYYRVEFQMTDRREPALADFLRVPLLGNPGTDPPRNTIVGGQRYLVRLLDRVAVFPLRAGVLHTGALEAWFTSQRLGARALRTSDDLVIETREPPLADRPPGYRLGDVGRFRLTASVEPRATQAGGAVAVLVRIEGTGNVPNALKVPERTGVEWLDPERRSEVETRRGRVGGWRFFGYVVRLHQSGRINLGTVSLPFYDPDASAYGVAAAPLGFVAVQPPPPGPDAGAPAAGADAGAAGSDPFATIGEPRFALGRFEPVPDPELGQRALWALVVAGPLAALVGSIGQRAARGLRRRRSERAADPRALARRAVREALRAQDGPITATAVERAVHLAIEAATGLKSRAVLLGDLEAELGRRGLRAELALRARELLDRCASLRFEPLAAAPDAPAGRKPAAALAAAAGRLVAELAHERPQSEEPE